ncbi:contractile injection system protein, VgrG/Pvc8 family [Teredinibacter sp. KSP-S5-2]|uniref:contractile injection system protein, VgrG/Pvc8 family n=1 Tax=Teredinibacter sp. KSP-S5-2 TaxID=3034506 RepID=UPI0029341C0C|nr:contractile injection system protein, VgrG/Pvc8 family [Teredinibacter sp. KSP-S5-2]WNO10453.1 contractile injection system protein, VgrG/Pvc8 family [Teredinibacter sp. KSP-S5-2]
MTPDFRLEANDDDITELIRTCLISLRVTDEAGIKSDALEIQLDDEGSRIQWPETGAVLTLKLGYKETGLTKLGLYSVDEVEYSGPVLRMTIRAKAADMRKTIKAQKKRFWEDTTLYDVVKAVSPDDLTPGVSQALRDIGFTYLEQNNESDLHFLTRIANENGAVVKPTNGYLIVAPRGETKSISGQSLPVTIIQPSMIKRFRFTQAERNKYASVIAYWHDTDNAEKQLVRVGEGDPSFGLRHTYPNIDEAKRAAAAKFKQLQRGLGNLELTLLGNVDIQAEGRIRLEGVRPPIQGEYAVTRVEHTFSSSGFITTCSAEIPTS